MKTLLRRIFISFVAFFLFASADMAHAQRMSLYANPFAISSGFGLNLGADFRIAKSATAGVYAAGGENLWGYGARLDYNIAHAAYTDGWYVSPFLSRYRMDLKDIDSTSSDGSVESTTGHVGSTNFGATLGYGWYADDPSWRLYFRFGLGLMRSTLDGDTKVAKADGTTKDESLHGASLVLPTADVHLGWMF